MRAEIFSNPFCENTKVTPVVIAYQDASQSPPYDLTWMAVMTAISANKTAAEFEPYEWGLSGIPVRSQEPDGAHLESDTREELIATLATAGYGDLELYEVVLCPINGVDTQKHLGKVDAQASTSTPRF